MSYRRSYSGVITGSVSGSVNYPASERGGSTSVTLHWQEPYNVDILVDTSPFDHSVSTVKHHIDALTGAVVTTEALHINEKIRTAENISKSVTDGFFSLIRSDITQQMAAGKSQIDSLLLKLADLKVAVLRIQDQMSQDYHRITERYSRVFQDLDQETNNRVGALDQDLIQAQRTLSLESDKPFALSTSIPTIFGGENSSALTSIMGASIRCRTNQLLINAMGFLRSERALSNNMNSMLTDPTPDASASVNLPVVFLAADDTSGQILEQIYVHSGSNSPLGTKDMVSTLLGIFKDSGQPWTAARAQPQVERYFQQMIENLQGNSAEHDKRVQKAMLDFWSKAKPASLPC